MPDQTRFSPDKVAAHEFLEALDRDATTWTFQTFDDNYDRKQPSLAKVLNGTLDDHWKPYADTQIEEQVYLSR